MIDQVRNIDNDIKVAKDSIALRDALRRLEKNRDFRKVFIEYYGKTFAHELVNQRGLAEMRAREQMMEANTRKIDGIGEFSAFMRNLMALGANAELDLKQAEATRDSIVRGEAEPESDEDVFEGGY